MGENFGEFSKGLDKFLDKEVDEAFIDLKNNIALDIFSGLVRVSPVDKGRFRGGWSTSLDNPSDFIPPEGLSSYPAPDESTALTPIAGGEARQMIWITNNLPYGATLNDGHSKQAPAGFFDMEVERVRSNI